MESFRRGHCPGWGCSRLSCLDLAETLSNRRFHTGTEPRGWKEFLNKPSASLLLKHVARRRKQRIKSCCRRHCDNTILMAGASCGRAARSAVRVVAAPTTSDVIAFAADFKCGLAILEPCFRKVGQSESSPQHGPETTGAPTNLFNDPHPVWFTWSLSNLRVLIFSFLQFTSDECND